MTYIGADAKEGKVQSSSQRCLEIDADNDSLVHKNGYLM